MKVLPSACWTSDDSADNLSSPWEVLNHLKKKNQTDNNNDLLD